MMNNWIAANAAMNAESLRRRRQRGDYVVMCRVSGGVTGTREAELKDRDGQIRHFATKAEADAEATRLNAIPRSKYQTADFRYWAEERN